MTANYEIDYDIAMPDRSIGYSEMNLYGYKGADMLPLLTDCALELFGADHTIYMLNEDGTEVMVFEREEITKHNGIFGIEASAWIASAEYADMIKALKISEALKEAAVMNDYDHSERFDSTIENLPTLQSKQPEQTEKPKPVIQIAAKKKKSEKSRVKVKRSILAQIENYKAGANGKESLNAPDRKNTEKI